MTTDRELLEKAAKAAEIPLGYGDGLYFYCAHGPFGASMYGKLGNSPLHWNPLTDDGDALRLAVKLAIEVVPDANGGRAYKGTQLFKEESDDRCAATRRAIVRAAAAIGEQMQ